MASNMPVARSSERTIVPAKIARERILEAVEDLFYREGIRAVGVDAVIAAAGVNKMSLYRNFASKDDLIAAYVEERDRWYWRWWDGIMAKHPKDPRRQLSDLFEELARRTGRPGYRGCPFVNVACEFSDPDHPGRKVVAANKREMRRRLRELSAAAGAKKPDEMADALCVVIEGAYASSQTFGAPTPGAPKPNSMVARAAELIIAAHLD
jgi:AcrR family transcriptional regulator